VREHHGKDESYFPYALPDAVVFLRTTEEVRDVVNICRRHRVPMIPYGVGTSLEGHILAVKGGVCIDLSQMNQVLAVHEADLDAVVQAGVTRKQLNEHIKHTGLFFPVDPGADATLGGMAATRASGTNAVRYGTMRENVLSLKVVLADGRIIQTSRRAKKSAAGYDLTRLFVGSEGTLGIITEVTVRLYPVQEAMSAAVCAFDSVDGCTNTVIQTIQSGIPIARCDIVCEKTVGAINKYKKTNYRVAPHGVLRVSRIEELVVEQAEAVQAIAKEHGGKDFVWATKPEERTQLWQARHDAYFACLQIRPGLARRVDRRVRADLAPRRVRARDHGGREELFRAGAAPRPHRRRQLPPHAAGRPGEAGGDRDREGPSTSAWSSARCAWKAPAPASTASAWARWAR
jgi:D-lactate dehydrogenase (cytochrome)